MEEERTEPTTEPEKQERPETEDNVSDAMEKLKELRQMIKDTNDIIRTGKGRLKLEKPITGGDKTIEELAYDFTALTGMEYTEAMDVGLNANDNVYTITNRQAFSLFAKAAAKQTDGVDQRDIMSQLTMTDALEGVQLAMIFFNSSTQAGRARISKM